MARTKQSSKRKRRRTALALGAAGVSLTMAGGASATAPTTNVPSQDTASGIILADEEISDVSLATFYVFDKENESPLRLGIRVAAHGGGGCGGAAAAVMAVAAGVMAARLVAARLVLRGSWLRGSWLRGSCLQRLWLCRWWRVDRRLLGLRRRLLLAMESDPGALAVRLLLTTVFATSSAKMLIYRLCDKLREDADLPLHMRSGDDDTAPSECRNYRQCGCGRSARGRRRPGNQGCHIAAAAQR